MLEGVNHIGIAVESLDEAIDAFERVFGVKLKHRELVDGRGVEVATLAVGDTEIEFIESKRDDSAIRRFLDRNGPGIHHVAFTVSDIDAAVEVLKGSSTRLVDEKPQEGKEGSRVLFIHPSSTAGILFELVEPSKRKR